MRSSIDTVWKLGGSLRGCMSQWFEFFSLISRSQAVWKSATGMIRRSFSRKGTTLPTRHFEFRHGPESRSASLIQEGISVEFPRLDQAVAKVIVRALIRKRLRSSPKDLLVLPDHAYEEWLNKEAVRYLQEQKAARQSPERSNHGNR